jgi:hypothetical protein
MRSPQRVELRAQRQHFRQYAHLVGGLKLSRSEVLVRWLRQVSMPTMNNQHPGSAPAAGRSNDSDARTRPARSYAAEASNLPTEIRR